MIVCDIAPCFNHSYYAVKGVSLLESGFYIYVVLLFYVYFMSIFDSDLEK